MTSPIVATDPKPLALEQENHTRNAARLVLKWSFRFLVVFVLFVVSFSVGGMLVAPVLPAGGASEPGLVSPAAGLLAIAFANLLVVGALILTSRWHGWRLAVVLALAYYGAVTFLMQIETWYFLSSTTVGPELLSRLFLMGIPTAFVAIPLAVWVLGRGRAAAEVPSDSERALPARRQGPRGRAAGAWIWKVAALVAAYVVLYFVAGYYIAWQNPELRAFYGQPGEALPFLTHMRQHSMLLALLPFQALRGLLWILCALPIIRGSRVGRGWTAILVGLFFSVPQNVAHLLANPLMPSASVRHTHLVETASSTFLFGVLVVWLLYRELGPRSVRPPGEDGSRVRR